jgi:methylmalonyl-CoA mutase N-terminal domain/subunit
VALQAFAATAGGCQSLHTNGYDEALALPTERSATLALRTQQVLLHESGVAAVPDPLGGSEYVEALTDELERDARALIAEIDELGGAVAAIESGWVKGRIEDQAFAQQRAIERGESVIVGVNRYPDPPDSDIELQVVTPESEQRQIDRLHAVRSSRDEAACTSALAALAAAARDGSAPLLEPMRVALSARCTVGEVCGALRTEWGSYDSQVSDGR